MFEEFIIHKFKKNFDNKKIIICTTSVNQIALQEKLSEEKLLNNMHWLRYGAWDYFVIENGKAIKVNNLHDWISKGYHLLNLTINEDGFYCIYNNERLL